MASRIQGITIEIGGDTTKLQSSLKSVDKSLKSTQSVLKDVNKLLKMDPGNIELLTQKQKALKSAIADTKDRLSQLKEAQNSVAKGSTEWEALQREIIATEQDLKNLEKQQREFGNVASQVIKLAGQRMEDFGKKISSVGDKLAPVSAAATAAITALGGMAYKAVQSADDLNTLAKQTGFTTDEIQKMQYASDLVDVSFDDMAGALKKLKPKISEDNEALAALGVAVTNADGSLRNANDVFFDAVEALAKIDNETERDQAAMELFGKSADSLAGIIDDGGAALKEYGQQAEDLGLIMSGDTLDALNEVNDTIDLMKAKSKGSLAQLGATLAKTLAPALEKVVGIVDKVSEALAKLTPEQASMIVNILGIVAAIGPALKIGGKIVSTLGTVVKVVGTLVGVLGGPLTIALAAVVAAGVLVCKNWDKIKEKATQLKNWLGKTWDGIKTTATAAWDGVKNTLITKWNNIKSAYENAGGGLKGVAAATMTGIKEYYRIGWDAINKLTGGKLDAIKSAVSGAWNSIKTTTATIWSNIKDTIATAITNAKNKVSEMIDKIKGFFKFDWELPKLKLPHIKLEKGKWPWGIMGEGEAPKVRIEWYKKAYQNPVMFTSPTVMATPSGAKGFGDGHGAEIVMGLNKLRELVGSSGVVINVYASAGMDVNALADKIQQKYVAAAQQRRLLYA